jgi:hypothetical protein
VSNRLAAIAVVLALAVTACSGGDDDAPDADAGGDDTSTSSESFEQASVELEVTRADLVSPHAAKAALDAETRDAVQGVVEQLLLVTSAGPLVEGRAGGGFADLFTADAGARAANADRAAFFDEGVEDFGELTPVEARVGMSGLEGSMDTKTALVVARFRWIVAGEHGDRIARTGELSLVPAVLPSGEVAWKIGAYTIAVTRDLDGSSTTTTATTA